MTRINYKRVPDAASASSAEEAFKNPEWPAFPSGAAGDGSYVHDDTSPLLLKAGSNEIDPKVEHAADLSIARELRGGDDGNAHAHTKRVSFWKEEHRELVSVGGGDLVTTACFDQGYLDFNSECRSVLLASHPADTTLQHCDWSCHTLAAWAST
jgi:hypothetical protein